MKKKIKNNYLILSYYYMNNITDNIVVNKSIELQNKLLENDYFRIFFLLITGVFIGYTLQPVPKWLNNLFDNSVIFKFIVLFIVGAVAVFPLDKYKTFKVALGAITVLFLFYLTRQIDVLIEKRKEKEL